MSPRTSRASRPSRPRSEAPGSGDPGLTPRGLVSLLRRRGFDCRAVGVEEHPRSGRHRLLLVRGLEGRVWLAKETFGAADGEGWFYSRAASRLRLTPPLLLTEPEAHLVVMEYVEEARDLQRIAQEDPAAALDLFPPLAEPLVSLHGLETRNLAPPRAQVPLPELDPVHIYVWECASPAAREFLVRVQRTRVLCEALRQSAAGLGPQGLVHGDLKSDNVLRLGVSRLIIDWELCGLGALGWDLGALLGSMVVLWADHLAVGGDTSPEDWVVHGDVPFSRLHSACCDFMQTYLRAAAANDLAAPDRPSVAVHTAAWIMARTWSDTALAHEMPASALVRLMIAEGLVRQPAELFGDLTW